MLSIITPVPRLVAPDIEWIRRNTAGYIKSVCNKSQFFNLIFEIFSLFVHLLMFVSQRVLSTLKPSQCPK